MLTHRIEIDESDRQVILLALAKLGIERPGWQQYIAQVAQKFGGENALLMLEHFKSLHVATRSMWASPSPAQESASSG